MSFVVLAIGLVLCVEGLVIALAPSRLDEALELLRRIPVETRRMLGLAALAAGVVMVWAAKSMGI
ncbi:MAG: DUF2065 domain-containing protein [Rhodobacteraceae bacterium]|nr:DUF2065 domain-containing protein [Paracoccaceae bacterium]